MEFRLEEVSEKTMEVNQQKEISLEEVCAELVVYIYVYLYVAYAYIIDT